MPLSVYVVDDERIAVSRLTRMLSGESRVSVIGSSTNPVRALDEIRTLAPDVLALLDQVRTALEGADTRYLDRVASRTGAHVTFVEIVEVTHFYTRDRLTFAATAAKDHAIDMTLSDLEQRLPPARWLRIHRSTIVNVDMVADLHPWFGGKLLLGLKNGKTRLTVARERVADVRARLGA